MVGTSQPSGILVICFSLKEWKTLPKLSPWCFNVAENQCIYCYYQSQANMPQAMKLLKIHQNIATMHWGTSTWLVPNIAPFLTQSRTFFELNTIAQFRTFFVQTRTFFHDNILPNLEHFRNFLNKLT
jgi:hypothetical protein